MKLGSYQRITLDQLGGGDIPGWANTLLDMLNTQLESVVTALTGRLSFADNLLCKSTTQTLTHATELKISVDSTKQIVGIIPLLVTNSTDTSASKNVITGCGVNLYGNGQAGVIVNFSAGGSTQAKVTLVILYG